MATETVEDRLSQLEKRLQLVEKAFHDRPAPENQAKRGWRAIVGIDAGNPDFEEAIRLGREWRFADSPQEHEEHK